jgi:hypothetical protein
LRKADPKSLSDEALSQICAETRIEKWLLISGCLGSVTALLLLFVSLVAFGDLARLLFISTALTAAALFGGLSLMGRPKRRYREELAYRRGSGPWPQYVAEAEAILRQQEADWALLFTLRGLPHGGFWWLQLTLKEGPPASARANLRTVPRWENPDFTRIEMDVPDDIVHEVMGLLTELDLAALGDISTFVIDGAPCRVTVLRREPWCVASASCNLAGLTPEVSQHPGAILCSKLGDIAGRLSPLR